MMRTESGTLGGFLGGAGHFEVSRSEGLETTKSRAKRPQTPLFQGKTALLEGQKHSGTLRILSKESTKCPALKNRQGAGRG
jgi:hypothetical protein